MYYARESIRRVREGGGKSDTYEQGREERESGGEKPDRWRGERIQCLTTHKTRLYMVRTRFVFWFPYVMLTHAVDGPSVCSSFEQRTLNKEPDGSFNPITPTPILTLHYAQPHPEAQGRVPLDAGLFIEPSSRQIRYSRSRSVGWSTTTRGKEGLS